MGRGLQALASSGSVLPGPGQLLAPALRCGFVVLLGRQAVSWGKSHLFSEARGELGGWWVGATSPGLLSEGVLPCGCSPVACLGVRAWPFLLPWFTLR